MDSVNELREKIISGERVRVSDLVKPCRERDVPLTEAKDLLFANDLYALLERFPTDG